MSNSCFTFGKLIQRFIFKHDLLNVPWDIIRPSDLYGRSECIFFGGRGGSQFAD